MPNIPKNGAAGQIPFSPNMKAEHERPNVPVGSQEHGPNAPSHGAAGGYDIDYNAVKDGEKRPTTSPPNKPMPPATVT